MTVFRRLCLLIDLNLANDSGRMVCLAAVAPSFGVVLFGKWWFVPSLTFAAVLTIFSFWRLSVMARTGLVGANADDLQKMPND